MKKLYITAIAALTTGLFATSALADGYSYKGFYAGFGVGTAHTKIKQNNDYYTQSTNTTEFTDVKLGGNKVGFDFYLGFNVNDWFAIESGYTSMRNTDVNYDFVTGSLDMSAWTLTPKFTAHLNQIFSVYAKGGLAYVDAKLSSTVNNLNTSVSDGQWGYTYGVGVEAAVTSNVSLRLSYDAYSADLKKYQQTYLYSNGDREHVSKAKANMDYFSVNVQYNF